MKFTYTVNHPLTPKEIEKGAVTYKAFITIARDFPWKERLLEQNNAKDKEIYFSPSLNLKNEEGITVSVSIAGDVNVNQYYISFNRPIWIEKRKWFKKVKVFDFFCSVLPGQTLEDALEAYEFLFNNDLEKLEERFQK